MSPAALRTTSYAVLGLLSFGQELSGYDLKKWADHSLRYFFWSPSISNVYGELKRLEDHGYVSSRSVARDELRDKRVFVLTPEGREALRVWIAETPVSESVLKDHALLRIWLGHVVGDEAISAVATEAEAHAREMAAVIEENVARSMAHPGEPFDYSTIVERWCLRYATMRAEAFAELRAELEARHPS